MTEPLLPRARRLRLVATVALWSWIAVVLAFLVSVAIQANGRLLAALGALASMLFATSFVLYATASRRETRAMDELVRRDDLRAARSRR
jgi:pilus assembly protein TadC